MKKRAVLLPILLLVLALGVTARAEDGANCLAPAPGDCWTVTNRGEKDVTVRFKNLDYVITDAEGYVTARDVSSPGASPAIPAGGQAIFQDSGSFSGVVELNGTFTAVKNEAPVLLHEELFYGEACRFSNQTDRSANVLARGQPSACVVFDRDGTVTETVLPGGSSGNNEVLLSVPAGGWAEVTPNGYFLYGENLTSEAGTRLVYCMARSANFTVERNVPSPWTFGAAAYNRPVALTNCTEEMQTVSAGSGPHALYDARGGLKTVSASGGQIEVPAGWTVALGSKDLNGTKYAFLTGAFRPSDLPGPVMGYGNRNLAVTFRNVSGKAAPLYGVTLSDREKHPDTYDITGAVSATEDGKGILLPNRASVTVTGTSAEVITIQGQFTVSGTGIPEGGQENAALTEGESCTLVNSGGEAVQVTLCGKLVSLYGDGKDVLKSYYRGYAYGRETSAVSVSPGASLIVQAVQGPCSLKFDAGALEVRQNAEPIFTTLVLRSGEKLHAVQSLSGYGQPYWTQPLGTDGDYGIQALDTVIFALRPWKAENTESPLVQTVTLNRGESCLVTKTTDRDFIQLPARGLMLMAQSRENGLWRNEYVVAPRRTGSVMVSKSSSTVHLTALEDGCTVWYYPALAEVRTGVEALYEIRTIPAGESLETVPKNVLHPDTPQLYVYGFNVRWRDWNGRTGDWSGEVHQGSDRVTFSNNTQTGWRPVRITAGDSDVTVVCLRDQFAPEKNPLQVRTVRFLDGGQEVSRSEVGQTNVETVELTGTAGGSGPVTLVLAACDAEGRQLSAVIRRTTAAELDQTLSIPFPCGTDTAAVTLYTIDDLGRPLMRPLTLAG